MDKIKELIKKMFAEKKSLAEIAGEVAKLQEAKEYSEDAKKLADMIKVEIKAIELAAQVEANEKKDAEAKAFDAKVKEAVKAELKSIPALKEEEKEVKMFDQASKKVFSTKQSCSEGLKAFAKLVGYIGKKDLTNAEAVEREIVAEKQKEYDRLGIKAVLRTDATTGSYLIPTEVELAIFEKAYQGVMLSRVNTNAITYNGKLYPVMADMAFGWIADETTQIADKTPTIGNPSVDMKRFGGMAYLSNHLLNVPTGLMTALANQYGNALQKFADQYIVVASATGSGFDPITGIAFDANTKVVTAKNWADITLDDLVTLKNWIDRKFRSSAIFLGNEKVRDTFGLLKDGAGNHIFSQFINTGTFNPLGKEFLVNDMIPSTITVSSKEPLTGASDIIMALDPSAIYAGFEPLRIATSEHLKFDYDQFAIRCVSRMGVKVIGATGTTGYVAAVQQLS